MTLIPLITLIVLITVLTCSGIVENKDKAEGGKSAEMSDKHVEKKKSENLDLSNISQSIKETIISGKSAYKKHRRSSSDQGDNTWAMNEMQEELKEISRVVQDTAMNIVKKDEIKTIVQEVVKNIMQTIKNEIKSEIVNDVKKELKSELESQIKKEIEENIKENQFITSKKQDEVVKEINKKISKGNDLAEKKFDGIEFDLTIIRKESKAQAEELIKLRKALSECEKKYHSVLNMANYNQQYSQKNNMKILDWPEKRDEVLRRDFCEIVHSKTGIQVNPRDILAIHRVPKGEKSRPGPRPVIAKFINSESRVAILKHRKTLKECFTLLDHLTPRNIELIKRLNSHPKIEKSWYFNTHVYAYDINGDRHRFDVADLDNLNDKLRGVRE
ncbi:hypothetical protein FSP39_002733 [Pinctada imbricata]|uniref:Uncharacterized protein n=1 Tax=Pinctada imbricata TaxID=66713 RepID=A0AA88YKG9_PINIB|nr:hypothetical protein FSP39_002733 [Pinctada imbricata]